MNILGWFEHLGDDAPPERIWADNEEVAAHIERIRSRSSSGGGRGGDREDIPDPEFGPMVENDLWKDV